MSIDINWEKATSGPDGEALAERIRSLIHDKFQQAALPRFIRSVQVHSFDFGTVPPDLEIKDLCDPFVDFYEEDDDSDGTSDTSGDLPLGQRSQWHGGGQPETDDDYSPSVDQHHLRLHPDADTRPLDLRPSIAFEDYLDSPLLYRAGTPGIPGGTSNLGHHFMSLGGLSGTQTPLAAVARGPSFMHGLHQSVMDGRFGSLQIGVNGGEAARLRARSEAKADNNSSSRPSSADTHPSHSSLHPGDGSSTDFMAGLSDTTLRQGREHGLPNPPIILPPTPSPPRMRERRPEDFQVICRAKYAGDVRLSLTAEILLDYPMPSFVGLPLKLNITGLTFDGVAVLAHIRRRLHFCFLSPEDADTLIGIDNRPQEGNSTEQNSGVGSRDSDGHPRPSERTSTSKASVSSLLRHIRVESEIGRKENGKQALKNVGKVERFVLDRVRQVFEEEFVFPSFWTFLI
jgi:mitochondrial distribution and morphology protein 12